MPLPRRRVKKGKKARKKPSSAHATDKVPAAPGKPQEISNLVVLTTSDKAEDEGASKPAEVQCVPSLELSGPATVASTLQMLSDMEQERIVHRKRSRVDTAAPQPLEFLKTPYGGRLLVHQSFLYKQEKAVGDKVYWKCRQHAALGCRGRAITRGLRATVMRDHCHPPDEEGLEARRQKGKLPGPALPEALEDSQDAEEGPTRQVEERLEGVSLWLYPVELESQPEESEPAPPENEGYRSLSLMSLPPKKRPTPGMKWLRPLEFLKTCYGGNFLVHQSFIYKREKTVRGKVYWTCRDHAVYGCRSRAITQGHRVTVMRGHCHTPDMKGLEARRQQEKAIKKVQMAKPYITEDCSDVLLRGVNSLFYHRGSLTRSRKQATVKDQEMTAQPESPQESPDEDQDVDPGGPEFLKTPLGGSFLVYESFLYRREKAAGDKVYWTCRDQARMGCRSRAITQGRQVTVMRGHCHPPDLMGLETLRQREKHPSATQWDSPEGPEFVKTPLGGSFLVYESFLYRREKAAGDKVYWTCRDQARMGCRSRAITQGQRVMVMRKHCHPPDLGGLEALRQRENFPNLTQWEGPEPLQPLEFLRTSLGGQFLVFESFLYRKEKAAGEKVYWMCRDQARLGCRSRAITQGRRVMVMRSHCHPPDLAGLEALRQRERLPSKARKKNPEKRKLLPEVQLCLETCSPENQKT
nr:FLYWCH-type zinc finger-containing protein 1 isoform X2 [Jaculus jaculus]